MWKHCLVSFYDFLFFLCMPLTYLHGAVVNIPSHKFVGLGYIEVRARGAGGLQPPKIWADKDFWDRVAIIAALHN